jgi:hypothetical protein
MTNSTQPGACPPDSPNVLPLPPTVADSLDDKQRGKVNKALLEYARDSAGLQRKAYAAVLDAVSSSHETGAQTVSETE